MMINIIIIIICAIPFYLAWFVHPAFWFVAIYVPIALVFGQILFDITLGD